jgi:hypothetical protein
MKSTNKTVAFGLYMFLCYVALFFIMKLFGWEVITELRILNIFIAIFFSNRLAKFNVFSNSQRSTYLGNLSSLMVANLIAVLASALGLMIYATAIDKVLMESIGGGFLFGENLTVNQVAVALVLEGSAISAIVSFSLMQYWKNTEAKTKTIERKV